MNLWTNLDYRAVRRDAPEFFDLLVGKRDAADRPILPTMEGADPTETVSNSVNHDVKAGGDIAFCGACAIIIRRIGNMQSKMEAALFIAAIDLVNSFGRSHVSFFSLRSDWVASQRDAVSLELPAVAKD